MRSSIGGNTSQVTRSLGQTTSFHADIARRHCRDRRLGSLSTSFPRWPRASTRRHACKCLLTSWKLPDVRSSRLLRRSLRHELSRGCTPCRGRPPSHRHRHPSRNSSGVGATRAWVRHPGNRPLTRVSPRAVCRVLSRKLLAVGMRCHCLSTALGKFGWLMHLMLCADTVLSQVQPRSPCHQNTPSGTQGSKLKCSVLRLRLPSLTQQYLSLVCRFKVTVKTPWHALIL